MGQVDIMELLNHPDTKKSLSVNEMAELLGLSDGAIRASLRGLVREGLVGKAITHNIYAPRPVYFSLEKEEIITGKK